MNCPHCHKELVYYCWHSIGKYEVVYRELLDGLLIKVYSFQPNQFLLSFNKPVILTEERIETMLLLK